MLFTQLMIGIFTQTLLQISLADIKSVNPGENITIQCNITYDSEILWYRLKSEEVKQIITAKKGKLEQHFSPSHNLDENHFDVNEDSSLVIIGVNKTDVGIYYCGGRNTTHVYFGNPMWLSLTDNRPQEAVAPPTKMNHYQIMNIILTCVCSISFLINIICICLFSSRVRGKLKSIHACCSETTTTHSAEKEINLHYVTLAHIREASDKHTSNVDKVTYAGIRHLPALS
ncbi:uncharacterized protein Hap1MRO34_003213 [Clarias gariepinus]